MTRVLTPQLARRLLFISLLLLPAALTSAQEPEQLPRATPFTGYHRPLQVRQLVGGFWRLDHTFASTLTIKNGVETSPIEVTPELVLANGTSHVLPPVTLQPAGVVSLDINKELAIAGLVAASPDSDHGTINLKYSWHWDGAMMAQLPNIDSDRSINYSSGLSAGVQDPTPKDQLIEGLWWRRTAQTGGFLRLTNASSLPLTVSTSFFGDDPQTSIGQTVTLAAQQTSVIDLKKIFDQVPGTPQQGGLRVCYRGPVNGLIADGGLEDADIGFSAYLNLGTALTESDTSAPPAAAISLASVGVVFGHRHPDMMFPGPVIFHPYLVVRNTTAAVRTITLSANDMYGEIAETAVLSNITLAPNANQTVDADGLIQRLNLKPLISYVNLTYAFSGQVSDVLISAGSIDGAGTYVFETPPLPSVRSMARTICYWQHGDGVDTKFTVWNHGGSAEDLVLTLYFDGGSYKLPIHLAAKASVMLDMEGILARQTPDADGATIPANVVEGSAKLSGSRGEAQHINATVDAASYNPAKATCQRVCVSCGLSGYAEALGNPDPVGFAVGATQQLTAIGQAPGGTQYNIAGSVSWASKNTAVSTVSTGGMATAGSVGATSVNFTTADYSPSSVCGSPPVCPYLPPLIVTMPVSVPPKVNITGPGSLPLAASGTPGGLNTASLTATGTPSGGTYAWSIVSGNSVTLSTRTGNSVTLTSQSAGTTQVEATYTLNGVPGSQIIVETVQQPTSTLVYADTGTTQDFNCQSFVGLKYNGDQRTVSYETLDQSGNDISNAGMPAVEAFTNVTTSCGVSPTPGNGQTITGGAFTDLFALCSSKCLPANGSGQPTGSCEVQATHTWSVNGFQVLNHVLTYTCTSINP